MTKKTPGPSPQDITGFIEAAKEGRTALAAAFIAKFGKRHIDIRNTSGDTALTRAARFNQLAVARLLLDAGAGVDVRNSHRGTPLMDAAVGGHMDVIRELLAHGADVDKKSYAHKTAHWYAEVNHHADAAALIADTPRRRAETTARVTAETAGSLTQGIEKPIVVKKPLRFAARS